MTPLQKSRAAGLALPLANVKRRGWNFPVVWLIPALAAIVAGYLIYQRTEEFGVKISIQFKDGSGLKIGHTPVKYRGVNIGEVRAIELSQDHQHALVKVRLHRSATAVAQEGSRFWIVRPELGIGNITGLGTIVAGPHIEVWPGAGKAQSEFVGLENPPVVEESAGLKLVLVSSRLGALKRGSPIYYRGIEVGTVQDAQLGTNGATVDIQVFIRERYTNLVRTGSKFWNASGFDVKFGLFRGAEINMESLKSLVVGGIAFATPDDPKSESAGDRAVFRLHDEPKKEWLEWSPQIPIPAAK